MWDTQGNRYLDCLSAYSAVNQGHCHPKILAAMVEQAGKLTLTSRAFHNEPNGRAEIIVCPDNFHGRTLGIIGFSTDVAAREHFGPFAPGFRIIPFGDAKALEEAITPNTVAFLVEPIQGEAGAIVQTGSRSGVANTARRSVELL